MESGARTPEELETLLEDVLIVRDGDAVRSLFEEGAVLVAPTGEARGTDAIARAVQDITYLAAPLHVVQARDTALVVSASGISVLRRRDAVWRFAISLLQINDERTAS